SSECRREDADAPRHRAGAHLAARGCVPPRVWAQELEQGARPIGVGEVIGDLGEEAHLEQPIVVLPESAESIGGEPVENSPCVVGASKPEVEVSQHAPEHRTRRVRGDRPGDDWLHLAEASLLSTKHVRLDPETEDRIPSLRTIAVAYRFGDQPLSLIESAVEEG